MPETNEIPTPKELQDKQQGNNPQQGGQDRVFSQEEHQAELNRVVGDVRAREREKFSDYDVLKEKAERLDKLEAENAESKSETDKQADRIAALEQALADERAERERVLNDAKRAQFASENGIPADVLIGREESDWDGLAESLREWRSGRPGRSEWAGTGDPGKRHSGYDGYQRAIDELKRKKQN